MNFALNYEIVHGSKKKSKTGLLYENIKLHDAKIYSCVEDGHSSTQALAVGLNEYASWDIWIQ